MKNIPLVLRCYAEQSEGQWQAICIDLNLAAQADTLAQVKDKLRAQIVDYIVDAVSGPDQEYAQELLTRKAPLALRMKYHFCNIKSHMHKAWAACSFALPLPMVPAVTG